MANDTIASGTTLTLSQPLSGGGTNIDFLNNLDDSGILNVTASAIQVTTLVSGGTTALVSASIGGDILNFQPGDQIALQNLPAIYDELDFAPDATSENASFANEITFAAESGIKLFIDPDGSITTSVNAPPGFTLDANTDAILNDIASGLFGTADSSATLTLSLAMRTNPNSNHPFIDGVITSDTAINPCFAAGTRILTVRGDVAVEALRVGDRAITLNGEEQEVVWVGTREIDITGHPRPDAVQPVIIEPDALGDGVPSRRLVVSPDHALYLDGVLVQAKDLVNSGTIRQNTAAAWVRYYHVELPAHDIIFAEGAAAESYLDTGHRGVFNNADAPVLLHPDLMQLRREAEGCAPLCMGGEELATIRRKLARRQTSPARQTG